MKIMYIECSMGASGDMILSALYEAANKDKTFVTDLNGIGVPGIRVKEYDSQSCGMEGTSFSVQVNGYEDAPGHNVYYMSKNNVRLEHIKNMISQTSVSASVKKKALDIYELLAEAKSSFQKREKEKLYFHEIGREDTITDIIGICMLMEKIAPDKVVVSPICTGHGMVNTLRGVLHVPTPMTRELLKDVPNYKGIIESELCTPSGAAVLRYFADEFGEMPKMTVKKTGIGIGKKVFNSPNCVRVYIGYKGTQDVTLNVNSEDMQTVAELSANIDDMTPERLAYTQELLFKHGALEVYTVPIFMKKNRSAYMLKCMCNTEEADKFAALILQHTTTKGVRRALFGRYTLNSEIIECNTEYGPVRVKNSVGFGIEKRKIEYEDLARIAEQTNRPIEDIANELMKALDIF